MDSKRCKLEHSSTNCRAGLDSHCKLFGGLFVGRSWRQTGPRCATQCCASCRATVGHHHVFTRRISPVSSNRSSLSLRSGKKSRLTSLAAIHYQRAVRPLSEYMSYACNRPPLPVIVSSARSVKRLHQSDSRQTTYRSPSTFADIQIVRAPRVFCGGLHRW